jgi:hypothetical protein
VIYDPDGQPLLEHLQPLLGSLLTKEKVKNGFKERQKAARPAMSDASIQSDWGLVEGQWDWLSKMQEGDSKS